MPTPERPGTLALIGAAWREWRNNRISDPAFQSWAARFPATRSFARREAAQLYDIVSGFVYSQTLLACVELDLFRHLDHPRTAEDLAGRIGLAPERAERLAQAATALRLLERAGDTYALGPLGAALQGAPGVVEMVRHHGMFYRDLSDPVALLVGGTETELSRYWSYVGGAKTLGMTPEEAAPYSRLMAASQRMVAEETLTAVSLAGIGTLLDVGGGEGAFLEAAAIATPGLEVVLFDLPSVADRARARFDAAGLARRARIVGGSFLEDPLPKEVDAISLIRVLYDHDDDVVAALLAKVRDALPRGGRLIVSEPMSGGERPTRSGDAYFNFYTLAMGTGRPRSPARHAEMLVAAGFEGIRTRATRQRFVTSIVTARKP